MDKTTQALLQAIGQASDNNEMLPAECWGHIGSLVHAWRTAGKPDLDESDALPELRAEMRHRHTRGAGNGTHILFGGAEYILCAANHIDDGVERVHQPMPTGIVFCGYRHHNIFGQYPDKWRMVGDRADLGLGQTQGFLTSSGRYVERPEAFQIATAVGQILPDLTQNDDYLFSEDLY